MSAIFNFQSLQEKEIVFFVSIAGNDNWSGKLPEPDKDNTDGPFATVEKARDSIRGLKGKAGGLKKPVTVLLRAGAYYRNSALIFTSQDSGTKECPVTYQAYPGEKPVISGGRVIRGWKKDKGSLWSAEIPEVTGKEKWNFNQLFAGGERRHRARTPNAGEFFYTNSPLSKPDETKGFYYNKGEINEKWENPEDIIIVLYHSWESSIHFISSLDTEAGIVNFEPFAHWPCGTWEKKQRYYIENVFEGLDSPGEWYLNKKTGVLYYYPMPGEDMRKAEVIAPVAEVTLINLQGNPLKGEFIDYVNFKGISFQHTNANITNKIKNSSQAGVNQSSLIRAEGVRFSNFENCEIAHAGEHAVWLHAGCRDNSICRCHIYDLGGGGVYIGEPANPADDSLATLRNTVDNNFIHDASYVFHGAHGVWAGKSSYNNITHNEICDFDYSAISAGWSWGFAASSANHNIIDYNHIHHLGNGCGLSDMGGIYTLGVSPGTTERYNLIHDIYSYACVSEGSGVYFDEGSSEILVENNIVYRVTTCPLFQHYGKDNIVRNNIFAFGGKGQLQRCREDVPCSYEAEGNIAYADIGQMLGGVWKNKDWKINKNIYWSTAGEPRFTDMNFKAWKEKGNDIDSVVADPLFYDAKNGDFRIKPDSPAIKMGFKPIDISKIGLYGEPEWVGLPKKYPNRKLADAAQ